MSLSAWYEHVCTCNHGTAGLEVPHTPVVQLDNVENVQ